MTRATASEQLSAWIDGELTDAEAAELEAELARDPTLRAELAELEAVVRTLHDEGPVQAPAGFRERVLARVEREHPARGRFAEWIRRPFGVPLEGWTLAAAAVAVLILTVLPALRRAPDPIGGEPAAIEVRSLPKEDGTSEPSGAPIASPAPGQALSARGAGEAKSSARWRSNETQGTATEVGAPTDGAAPAVDPLVAAPPEPPDPVLDSYTGRQRFVARITDAEMKQTLLAYLSYWGGATDVDGAEIESGTMSTSREDLLITIPEDELFAFTNGLQQLRRQGIDVQWDEQDRFVRGDTVNIAVTLELVADP